MTIDAVNIEDAIHAWVVAATGLAEENVFWAQQGEELPEGTFISMRAVARPVARGWLNYEDNPAPSAGAELLETYKSLVELELQLQVFAGEPTGVSTGSNYILKCRAAAKMSERKAALEAGGWSPARWDSPQDIGQVVGSAGVIFEPRTVGTCYGYCASELVATATYIEFAELSSDLTEAITLDLINEEVV